MKQQNYCKPSAAQKQRWWCWIRRKILLPLNDRIFPSKIYKTSWFLITMDFKEEIVTVLNKETKLSEEELTNLLNVPPDPKLGDYAFPCFRLGKNPKEEAERLKAKLKLPKSFSKVEVSGPYLNFFVNNHFFTE